MYKKITCINCHKYFVFSIVNKNDLPIFIEPNICKKCYNEQFSKGQ